MTGFGLTNFQQSAQQRAQQFHQEASQRAMEMHQQAQQHAQQSAHSPQWLWEVHQRQHQQWLENLRAGGWADQQRRKQQGYLQDRPPLLFGQRVGRVPATMEQQRGLARTDLQPTELAPVQKERGGCARVVGGVLLFLLLGLCVSQVLIPLIM
jgi:hypothetical protein